MIQARNAIMEHLPPERKKGNNSLESIERRSLSVAFRNQAMTFPTENEFEPGTPLHREREAPPGEYHSTSIDRQIQKFFNKSQASGNVAPRISSPAMFRATRDFLARIAWDLPKRKFSGCGRQSSDRTDPSPTWKSGDFVMFRNID